MNRLSFGLIDKILVGLLLIGCVLHIVIFTYEPYKNIFDFFDNMDSWKFTFYIILEITYIVILCTVTILGSIRLLKLIKRSGFKAIISIKYLHLWISTLLFLYITLNLIMILFWGEVDIGP